MVLAAAEPRSCAGRLIRLPIIQDLEGCIGVVRRQISMMSQTAVIGTGNVASNLCRRARKRRSNRAKGRRVPSLIIQTLATCRSLSRQADLKFNGETYQTYWHAIQYLDHMSRFAS